MRKRNELHADDYSPPTVAAAVMRTIRRALLLHLLFEGMARYIIPIARSKLTNKHTASGFNEPKHGAEQLCTSVIHGISVMTEAYKVAL